MGRRASKLQARDFYNQEASNYVKQYHKSFDRYPANLIRIKFIEQLLKANKVRTVFDVGCGSCGAMMRLLKAGFDVRGIDFSKDMLSQGKRELEKAGFDPDLIGFGDIEKFSSLQKRRYDAILALGVFPHVVKEKKALLNMRRLLNPGGLVYIEFRNDLFDAFTLNNYSLDFFMNKLLDLNMFPASLRREVSAFYASRLKDRQPVPVKNGKVPFQGDFHNPLTLRQELFEPCGFSVVDLHFYHYHALPPRFEKKNPKLFRELSLKMERTNDWKGYLMASAFVVEARKNK